MRPQLGCEEVVCHAIDWRPRPPRASSGATLSDEHVLWRQHSQCFLRCVSIYSLDSSSLQQNDNNNNVWQGEGSYPGQVMTGKWQRKALHLCSLSRATTAASASASLRLLGATILPCPAFSPACSTPLRPCFLHMTTIKLPTCHQGLVTS